MKKNGRFFSKFLKFSIFRFFRNFWFFRNSEKSEIFQKIFFLKMFFDQKKIIFFDGIFFKVHLEIQENRLGMFPSSFRNVISTKFMIVVSECGRMGKSDHDREFVLHCQIGNSSQLFGTYLVASSPLLIYGGRKHWNQCLYWPNTSGICDFNDRKSSRLGYSMALKPN